MKMKSYCLLFASASFLFACGSESGQTTDTASNTQSKTTTPSGRANTAEVMRGRSVFKQNCQTCHGEKGIGQTPNWRKTLPNGKYPAPPLNGSGHTWHHPESVLLQTINRGGLPIGGTMPAFKDQLSDKDKQAVLSYIQSLWPEKIYQIWQQQNKGK